MAKFLTSFCGIASFGVVTRALALGIAFLVLFAVPVSITLLNTNNAHAVSGNNSSSNTITANLPGSVAIRLLDSTASTEISSLDFSFDGDSTHAPLPTASGVTSTKSFIVDVATSNPTGYKLYMQSDYQTKDSSGNPTGNYTTNLTHTDTDVSDVIPTAVPTSGSPKVYWNYVNPLLNEGVTNSTPSVIPPYGTPDKIAQGLEPTNSDQTEVAINVGIDTTIVSGTYENQLLFSAVGNPDPVAYTINFDTDGGSPAIPTVEQDVSASVNDVKLTSTIPTKTGYTFQYWNIESITSTYTDPATNITTTSTLSSNPATPATASCIDQTTGESKSTCNPGDTLRTYANGEDTVTVGLKAIYTINSHTITANTSTGIASTTVSCPTGTGSGSGSGSGSNTCNYGDTVTISATTSTGYHFNNWTVNSGGATPASPTSATTTFTMTDSNVVVTANATINSYAVTINKGTGINSVTGAGTYNYGSTVTITASPSSGYKFKNWTVNSGGITPASSTSASTTFTMPDNAVTLTANGEADSPAGLCASASRGGEFTVNGVTYKKLNNDKCYTKTSRGTATWANAASLCPTGTSLPSKTDFDSLVSAYSGGGLYSATGWSGGYWSSTSGNTNYAYLLRVDSSSARVLSGYKTASLNVVCIVSS